ncbi:unnamed protein product [Rhodiola kirilowii]
MANPDVNESAVRYHAVFIDSSLDTHMLMGVDEVDTVADLKKKIHCQHALCFPDLGEININSLQVKRRGLLYHLSDSMSIRTAFDGVKSSWFVYVDVCRMVKHDMEISVPLPKASGILRCLECKTLADRVNYQLNEPEKTLGKLQNDDCLNQKDDCNNTGDAVRKVLDDLDIELEHMGDNQVDKKRKADDLRYVPVAEIPEVLHSVGAKVHLKSGKKAKKEKNNTESGRKKKAKSVTEKVETTKDDILSSQNPEYMGSNLERTNISHLRLVGETVEVLEGTAKGRNVLNDVRGPDESDTQVVKVREANPEASQFKAISNPGNPVHAAEKDKNKSKRKRSSATNPSEIKLKENTVVINPSQSNNDMNSRVKTVEAEKGELANQRSVDGLNETAEKKNDKEVASAGTVTVTETADAFQVQRKHLDSNIGTTTVGDYAKGTKHSSATESFRAPRDRAPSTSNKQKLQSSKKRSKQASSEVVARRSPSANETQKSNPSREATKLNKNQSKAVSQYQLTSPVGTQRTKSKQSASKKSSIAEVKNAENTAISSSEMVVEVNHQTGKEMIDDGTVGLYVDVAKS